MKTIASIMFPNPTVTNMGNDGEKIPRWFQGLGLDDSQLPHSSQT